MVVIPFTPPSWLLHKHTLVSKFKGRCIAAYAALAMAHMKLMRVIQISCHHAFYSSY